MNLEAFEDLRKRRNPRFFFVTFSLHCSSSYITKKQQHHWIVRRDLIQILLNSKFQSRMLFISQLLVTNATTSTIRGNCCASKRWFRCVTRIFRYQKEEASMSRPQPTRNVPSTHRGGLFARHSDTDFNSRASRLICRSRKDCLVTTAFTAQSLSRARYLRLDLEHRLQSTCLQRPRNVG